MTLAVFMAGACSPPDHVPGSLDPDLPTVRTSRTPPPGVVTPSPSQKVSGQAGRGPGATPSADPGGGLGDDVGLQDHSTTDPTSIWVVVNKKHPLPAGFTPDLTIVEQHLIARAAAPDLAAMLAAADRDGTALHLASAYRSYAYQRQIYRQHVTADGAGAADRYSARPGYSEHQTGLAVDVTSLDDQRCSLQPCFGATPAGRWVRTNAARYGFIVRYTEANKKETGYQAEPWHLRYVGRPLAQAMRSRNVGSLEAVFGIRGGGYRR